MIRTIQIMGFRGFSCFEMSGLGRINLLVGTNNSGKTSVLEAIYLLNSDGDLSSLWQLMGRRGEHPYQLQPQRPPEIELDICHLFTGHEIHIGSKFVLSSKNSTPERSIEFTIGEDSRKDQALLTGSQKEVPNSSSFALLLKGAPMDVSKSIPLTRLGGISPQTLALQLGIRRPYDDVARTNLISAESLSADQLIVLWDTIALTPDENLVLKALQFLDPKIEGIRAQASLRGFYGTPGRGGFIIKRKGTEHPIPIGSMGDGMWRMLAMAIAITQCKNGILLVDEIDTGLHYSVMAEMWRLILNAAKAFNVQVFATTHSYDCVKSLSAICVDSGHDGNNVTVQRIEPERSRSVPYTEDEIRVAAERHVEVR